MTAPLVVCDNCLTAVPSGEQFCPRCGNDVSRPGAPPPSKRAMVELRGQLAEALSGRYRIERILGAGGMGAVFLAEEVGLEREVAIKVLPPKLAEDPSVVARFEREAKTAARLDHTHIIPIYRVESEGGLHYFVMKYVAGRALDSLIAERGQLPVAMAVRILSESAAALEHAHRKGVVHRDIKPANILLDQDDRVLLADFGIAKALAGSAEITHAGAVIGTPYYMSPEQALGVPVDGRSDQYSLAVVGYRMLTGEALFDGDSSMTILYKHIHTPPPRLREKRTDVPEQLERAILKALAKAPADRFESMTAFARAIRGEEEVTLPAAVAMGRPATPEEALTSAATIQLAPAPVGGRRRSVVLGVLALLAIVAGAWWYLTRPRPAAPAPALGAPAAAPSDTAARRAETPTRPAPRRSASRDSAASRAPADSAAPAFTGAPLTVNATPFGTLFIDDARIGGTPVVGRMLVKGSHVLRVEREGCKPKVETVQVTSPAPIKRQYALECTP